MVSERGKIIRTKRVELPENNTADVQASYKYLGFPQATGNHEEAARTSATAKYLRRVRKVQKSRLNGKNKYTLPVIRYPAGIKSWAKEETEATD
ncbi:uncharacterized protein AKAME5_002303800 [Lates japonicus]|uniref:Uncharacterized protein n=1 Tax=Lates japonicus TaxID=270547 RepID=A0AAD3RKF7_LATJO|nr:uncharacterized protein AKAME5_002303800 [Lates japonicus]